MKFLALIRELTSFGGANAIWLIPLALLLLQLVLKLLIADTFSALRLWIAILASPVEIGFLSLSFTASVLLSQTQRAPTASVASFVYVALLAISVAIWKCCPTAITKAGIIKALLLSFVNFTMTLTMLVYSVSLLQPVK